MSDHKTHKRSQFYRLANDNEDLEEDNNMEENTALLVD